MDRKVTLGIAAGLAMMGSATAAEAQAPGLSLRNAVSYLAPQEGNQGSLKMERSAKLKASPNGAILPIIGGIIVVGVVVAVAVDDNNNTPASP